MSKFHPGRPGRSAEAAGLHKSYTSFGASQVRLLQLSKMARGGVYLVRTHLFFKVEVEHDEDESPGKIGEEIGRQLRKLYMVRSVELSSVLTDPD